MFYCEPCAVKNKWPREFYLPQSYGPCEVCRKTAACFDVPSRNLPEPPLRARLTAENAALRRAMERIVETAEHAVTSYGRHGMVVWTSVAVDIRNQAKAALTASGVEHE